MRRVGSRLVLPAMLLATAAACGPMRGGAADPAPPAGAATTAAQPAAGAPAEPRAEAAADTPEPRTAKKARPIQLHRDRLRWMEGPLPGTRMTVLEGNPKESGSIYTVRLSVNAGTKLEPHTHPQDERVTVLEGSVLVGFGESFEEAKGKRFGPGDYYVNPANTAHFVWFDEKATIQLTGVGPWTVTPVSASSGNPTGTR